jgi:hypothetical protein
MKATKKRKKQPKSSSDEENTNSNKRKKTDAQTSKQCKHQPLFVLFINRANAWRGTPFSHPTTATFKAQCMQIFKH